MAEQLHRGHRQRMMEKFSGDPGRFYDHELLEIFLYYAMPRVDTNPLAHRLLARFGSIERVLSADETSLLSVEGVGKRTAAFLRMHGELYRRIVQVKPREIKLVNSLDGKNFVKEKLKDKDEEEFLFVFMDGLGKVLSVSKHSDGMRGSVGAKILEMVRSAAALKAKNLLIAHNHPSGSLRPSEEDLASTDKLRMFCEMCEMRLIDHVIVAAGGETFSMRDAGYLN